MKIETLKVFKKVSWKNGLGFTEEMLIDPADADFTKDFFIYRISSAQVSGKTSFSLFSGYQRLLVLLNGKMQISHEDSFHNKTELTLEAYTPYFFSGHLITHAEVQSELNIRDFGIIFLDTSVNVACEIINSEKEITLDPDSKYYLFSSISIIKINGTTLNINELGCITSDQLQKVTVNCTSSTLLVTIN